MGAWGQRDSQNGTSTVVLRKKGKLERGFTCKIQTQCNKGVFRSPYHLSVHVLQGFPSAPETKESSE